MPGFTMPLPVTALIDMLGDPIVIAGRDRVPKDRLRWWCGCVGEPTREGSFVLAMCAKHERKIS